MDWVTEKFLLSEYLELWSDSGVEHRKSFPRALLRRGLGWRGTRPMETSAPQQIIPATPWTILGPPESALVFVEVAEGPPFHGEPGQLLDRILEAMKLTRSDVRLVALAGESLPTFDPAEVVVACGAGAASRFLGSECVVKEQRGRLHSALGLTVQPTYHPADLLESPALKKDVWEDMKRVLKKLGR